jgi:molybdopterin converting factor small subunit
MIRVTVKVFGPLKDILQKDELLLDVPPPHTGKAALDTLAAQAPALQRWQQSVRLAVNLEYVSLDHVMREHDEISFIPPVSGG